MSARVRRIASPLLGCALAVAVMELVVRDVYTVRTTSDPEIGVIYDPASPVRWRREGNGTSHWDARGVRKNGRVSSGRDGAIVMRGDSFTEALMVDDDEAYPSVVQDLLAEAGLEIATLNVGRSTDSAADHVAHAERTRRVFAPRWTTIQLRHEDFSADAFDDTGAKFVVTSDGSLTVIAAPLEGSAVRAKLGAIEKRSMLVAYGLLRAVEMENESRKQPPLFFAADGEPTPPPPDTRVYPVDAELAAIVAAYQGKVTLVWLTDSTPDEHEARFDRFCRETKTSCVSTRRAFDALRAEGHSPYGFANTVPDSGHMNRHGQRVLARALADEILRLKADGLF